MVIRVSPLRVVVGALGCEGTVAANIVKIVESLEKSTAFLDLTLNL